MCSGKDNKMVLILHHSRVINDLEVEFDVDLIMKRDNQSIMILTPKAVHKKNYVSCPAGA